MIRFLSLLFLLLPCSVATGQLDFTTVDNGKHQLLVEMSNKIEAGDYEQITSVLIAKDGNVLFEKYYNGASRDSKHNTRSATKTIATLITGIAIDKGYIDSEKDKIFKYLQHKLPVQNPDDRKQEITIEDLLTMSSILECDDNNQFSRGNEERMYIIEDWLQFFLDLPIKSYPWGPRPEELPYGRSMSYCSAGAAALAEIVQSAVKMEATKFAHDYLLKPLEITDFKFDLTPNGTLNTAGGSNYRSRDLLKLIQMCINNGRWNGNTIISSSWLDKATTPKVNAWEGMDYGFLFWLRKYDNATCYAMAGNGGNKVVAFPELGITVVLTATNYNNRKAHGYTDELLEKFIVPALKK